MSGDDGLWSAIVDELSAGAFVNGYGDLDTEGVADAVLALPEVAALRAKAAAADRVRELAAMWNQTADRYLALSRDAEMPREHRQRTWDQYQTLREVASDVRRALDGQP